MTQEEMRKYVEENTRLFDWSWVKTRLYARLAHRDSVNAEVCRSAEPYGFDDLIIVPYVRIAVDEELGHITTIVGNSLLDLWHMDANYVLDRALSNSVQESIIRPMQSLIAELSTKVDMNIEEEDLPEVSMYVLSNNDRMFGAISSILLRSKVERIFPEGYVVIPSSVHECIVISKFTYSPLMEDLIRDINGYLSPKEVLSDKAYLF